MKYFNCMYDSGSKTNFLQIQPETHLDYHWNFVLFIIQFDPITSKESTSTVTTESNSTLTSSASQDKVDTVTVSPTVALTTSGGITSNVAIETKPGKTPNESETVRQQETNKEKSESSSIASEQVREQKSRAAANNNSSTSEDASKKEPDKAPVIAPEPEPPVSPTGSLHSDSGASATGVRNSSLVIFIMPLMLSLSLPRSRF